MKPTDVTRWLLGGGWRRHLLLVGGAIALAAAGVCAKWVEEHFEQRVKRYAEVVPGVLYRSMQPHGGQWNDVQERGIKTVIDLRTQREDPRAFAGEERRTRSRGIRLVSLPISEDVPESEHVVQFVREVRAGPAPVLVHCEFGRTRTGHMLACYLVLEQGWSPERAIAYIRDTGASLGEGKLERLQAMLEDFASHREDWQRRIAQIPQTTTTEAGESP
jgi:protein tyrosine/serine phosphatase